MGLKPENRVEEERKERILSPIVNVLKSCLEAANGSMRELKMVACGTGRLSWHEERPTLGKGFESVWSCVTKIRVLSSRTRERS